MTSVKAIATRVSVPCYHGNNRPIAVQKMTRKAGLIRRTLFHPLQKFVPKSKFSEATPPPPTKHKFALTSCATNSQQHPDFSSSASRAGTSLLIGSPHVRAASVQFRPLSAVQFPCFSDRSFRSLRSSLVIRRNRLRMSMKRFRALRGFRSDPGRCYRLKFGVWSRVL